MSRIVSSSEPIAVEPPKTKVQKPKVLHMAAWIHAISFVISIAFGWIDIIPGTGSVSITVNGSTGAAPNGFYSVTILHFHND